MKKMILIMFLFTFTLISTFACNIKISMDKNEYKINDYVIITVDLYQEHNNCLHENKEPKIIIEGLELIGKTKFSEIENNKWQIKYKAKVINKNVTFVALRECAKGGDEEKIIIKVL